MNFIFSETQEENKELNLKELCKLLYNEELVGIESFIKSISIPFAITSGDKWNLKKGKEIDEIYVIHINMVFPGLPLEFLKKLDEYINFPVLFVLIYKGVKNYILPVKLKNNNKNEILRIFYTGWITGNPRDINLFKEGVETVDDVYKKLVLYIGGSEVEATTIKETTEKLIDLQKLIKNPCFVLDTGVGSFHSIKERFVLFNAKAGQQHFFDKYMIKFGYESYTFSHTMARFFNINATMRRTKCIKLKESFLEKYPSEIGYLKNSDSYEVLSYNYRTEEEIETMKKIYGKYLNKQKGD